MSNLTETRGRNQIPLEVTWSGDLQHHQSPWTEGKTHGGKTRPAHVSHRQNSIERRVLPYRSCRVGWWRPAPWRPGAAPHRPSLSAAEPGHGPPRHWSPMTCRGSWEKKRARWISETHKEKETGAWMEEQLEKWKGRQRSAADKTTKWRMNLMQTKKVGTGWMMSGKMNKNKMKEWLMRWKRRIQWNMRVQLSSLPSPIKHVCQPPPIFHWHLLNEATLVLRKLCRVSLAWILQVFVFIKRK